MNRPGDLSTAIPVTVCPSCGCRFDTVTMVAGGGPPKPLTGLLMCTNCTEVMRFDPDKTLRMLAAEEYLDLPIAVRRCLIKTRAALVEAKRRDSQANG